MHWLSSPLIGRTCLFLVSSLANNGMHVISQRWRRDGGGTRPWPSCRATSQTRTTGTTPAYPGPELARYVTPPQSSYKNLQTYYVTRHYYKTNALMLSLLFRAPCKKQECWTKLEFLCRARFLIWGRARSALNSAGFLISGSFFIWERVISALNSAGFLSAR